ncbi:hypothetical protein K505DRAFT_374565 [Melanomma pulvis-pyrius CBS 109.77]|uniref:Rhodopsin domain-containing protein n=1 Tax=Melanomma pulvis-pyrius CBS 109.77 TaxID=1314802 RepID=A0A6A6XEJ9_9PLEO|nr:hypothetical protein K505DRAFT_374565 [Melanomma pulvis-pyrius CBS 109.77]
MADHPPSQGKGPNINASFVNSSLLGVAISLPIAATLFAILRLYARRIKGDGKLRADDWTILITLALCWGHSINTLVAGGIGGINTITLPPREYANVALRTLWISSFFLITALYMVKISILLFYHRLFSIHRPFGRACLAMISILSLWWISSLILVFLSTDPIEAAWKNAAAAKHRFDFNTWYISYSGLSILFDIVILCFPIPMIKSLQVNTKQKISILGIFWLGGFVCVSAIIRFVLLYNSIYRLSDYGKNQYSSITAAFIWAEVEPNTSVIAACLPTYGPLFRGPLFKEGNFFPAIARSLRSMLGMTRGSTRGTHPPGTSNTNTSQYYELDKTASNKSTSKNLYPRERGTDDQDTDVVADAEAQRKDSRQVGVPKAWFPPY